jgi:hypothetical protein
VALEEMSIPRLIVAASHTALSGDLGVLIIEFPSTYHTSTPGVPITITTEDIDVDIDLEEDDEDYSIENEQISPKDPFILRFLSLLFYKNVFIIIYMKYYYL